MNNTALKRMDEPSNDARFLAVGDLAHADNESGQLLTLLILKVLDDSRYYARIVCVTSEKNQRVDFIGDEIEVSWDCLYAIRRKSSPTT